MAVSITEIVLLVIGGAVVLLALMLVPAIASIRRAASSVADLADLARTEISPVLKELKDVLHEVKTVSAGVAEHTDDVKKFMASVGETGSNLHTINRTIGTVAGTLNATSAWIAGAKVAGSYIVERYLKRKGGQ